MNSEKSFMKQVNSRKGETIGKISQEFESITGFALTKYRCNRITDFIRRKDALFSELAELYFFNRNKFQMLLKKMKVWLRKEESVSVLSLAGYVYYIAEDFKSARRNFLKAVSIEPDNLDSGFDLAFTLRHLGEHRASSGIFFHFPYVIHYYKHFKLNSSNYNTLRALILEITKKINEE